MAVQEMELLTDMMAEEVEKQIRFSFEPCQRQVNSEVIRGEQCNSTGDAYYHNTEIRNLPSIRNEGVLKPSPDPHDDGTVNFTLNPNLHRFGSIRFVFDRNEVDEKVGTQPMCYATGDDQRKEVAIVDRLFQDYLQRGEYKGRWRIEHEIGAETTAYRNECKRYTTKPVPIKLAKAVEYWLPWKPSAFGNVTGCNVSPTRGIWDAWSTGLPNTLEHIRKEIREAKEFAKELGIPFKVRSCYPYAKLDGYKVIILDKKNLERLEKGEEPEVHYEGDVLLPPEECLCPPEEIPPPEGKED